MTEKTVANQGPGERISLRDGLPKEDIKVVIQELEAMNLETLREKYIPIEKKKKFRENYNLFDRRNVEALDYDEMKEFLTSVGQMLPEDELEEFYKNLADQKGISLSNTEIIIIKKLREEDLEEQITEAFRIIDKEKLGSIESEYFKEMLMTNGYKWPEDKADQFLKDCDPKGEGRFEFAPFVKKLMK